MFNTRESWLTEAAHIILGEIIAPHASIRESLHLKISVGYPPNTRADSRTIAVCLSSKCSTEGYNEIFIHPRCSDPVEVLGHLTHEIIHAVDDCKNGHRGEFRRIARSIGLEGKLTATVPGDELRSYLEGLAQSLGPLPHAGVDLKTPKKAPRRLHSVNCSNTEKCGFKFQTSRQRIIQILDKHDNLIKCMCCDKPMTFDYSIL